MKHQACNISDGLDVTCDTELKIMDLSILINAIFFSAFDQKKLMNN